ncbi:MAG: anhydro-N-acetylmuramic acid kinase [Actinomycetota bacterium]
MRIIGIMSGTSHDGVDVAAADFSIAGNAVLMKPLGFLEHEIPDDLDRLITDAISGVSIDAQAVCRLDTELGQLCASAAARALGAFAENADLIVSHGQTIWHWEEGGRARGTLQLGNPAWIAEETGVAVLSDIRMRDVAAGGNGAPLASTFDTMLASGQFDEAAAFLNLGGISNMTIVGAGRMPIAYDLGPANALVDAAMVRFTDGRERFDAGGERARAGRVQAALLERLMDHPYYALEPPKATGKETFSSDYLASILAAFPEVAEDDVLATLTEHAAALVAAEAESQKVSHVIASGGGVRNPYLVERLRDHLADIQYLSIEELGVSPESKEAYMMALLGFLSLSGVGASVPSCTGASDTRILGTLTPGASGWPRIETLPADTAPSRLVILDEGNDYGVA